MQNQTKPEPSGAPMAKLILVVAIIVCLGAVAGVAGYCLTKKKPIVSPTPKTISAIEISADKKSILNSETKEVIFTINDAQKYLKNSGYAYDPNTFQTTNAKHAGDCFFSAVLSNAKNRIINNNTVKGSIVFSTGCLSGDLLQAWIGIYNFGIKELTLDCALAGKSCINDKQDLVLTSDFQFLIGGSGKNFVWSQDNKTVTYEADLGLSGMTETRTIDAVTGDILERKNISAIDDSETKDWQTYRNEEYGFEVEYPSEIFTINAFNPREDNKNTDNVSFYKISTLSSPDPLPYIAINIYSNPNKLLPEDYLRQNYQKWLGVPSNYSDFRINKAVDFNGMFAREFGTDRDNYVIFGNNNYIIAILHFNNDRITDQILSTFKFIE